MARQKEAVGSQALEEALALYRKGAIELEGLCRLMAAYGAGTASAAGQGSVHQLAVELGLLVHERRTVASADILLPASPPDPMTIRMESAPASEPARAEAQPPNMSTGAFPVAEDDDAPATVVFDQSAQRASPERSAADMPPDQAPGAPGYDAASTALGAFCAQRGVLPRVHPGLRADAPALDGAGDRHYAFGGELGVGGMGRVLTGTDRELRRSVAVKVLRDENLRDPIQLQAFIEEAIITGGLEHPNIVPVYHLGYAEQTGPYYAMKQLGGRPLSRILRDLRTGNVEAEGRFGLFRLLGFFVDICRAIAFAHLHGVIHCDLKPANIIVDELGEVTVVDWGLARVLGVAGRGQARALLTSGTPAYMPPEQATGTAADLDEQSDVWSLGAILYELLTLTVPFRAETSEETVLKLIADPVEPPGKRAPDRAIPLELERICCQALEKSKLVRYPSVRDILSDLESYLEGTREKRRRDEIAQQAVSEVERVLQRHQRAELEVDRLQAVILADAPEGAEAHELHQELEQARDDLVFGYTDATAAIKRGHEARADDEPLLEKVGDLYWRIFGRLYPARVTPPEQVRDVAVDLLASLAERGLAAIVQVARNRGSGSHPTARAGRPGEQSPTRSMIGRAPSDDPWLDAVLSFCGDELELDPDQAPSAMAPLIRRIVFLKEVPLFAGLSGSDLLPIAEACERKTYADGDTIFAYGDPGDALYVVTEGRVRIVRDGAVLNTLGTLDCFGEIAVLDRAPRTAGAVCASDVSCLMLTAARFRRIVRENGDIALSVFEVLTERLRRATLREATLRSGTFRVPK